MCGITGIYNADGRPVDRAVMARMSGVIAHRGPDGERFYFDEAGVGLAHRALRIIDLSDAARQPMFNEDGSLVLVFNGEIYNYIELRPILEARGHKFSSHSDSETILHAYEEWGTDCLQKFNGMFGFALWDSKKRTLFVARDRAGVKPVYYAWRNKTLAFGSEIKSILQHPDVTPEAHLPAIAEYMSAMYTSGEHTWFKGIRKLLPGHYMLVTPDGLTVRQWWDMPTEEDGLGEHSEQYYIRKVRELLEDSVKLRLRSDVPLGSHLSGGLDSSAIVALLSRQLAGTGEKLRTFSGAFAEGAAYDERRFIRDVARKYGTQHNETVPTADDLRELLDKIVWHMDEPAAGPGILLQWAVCKMTREAGVIVVNGGQGGDEAWGGYFGYIPAYVKSLAQAARKHPKLAGELLRDAALLLQRPDLRNSLVKAVRSGRRGRLQTSSAIGEWAGPQFAAVGQDGDNEEQERYSGNVTGMSPLARVMRNDLKWYLPALLQVEDRTSMAHSLESRAPLLDYRLLELSASVPAPLRMKGLQMKHILREAVADLLPRSVYARKDKKGMPTPVAPWFKGQLAGWVRESLTSEEAEKTGLFNKGYVESTLQEHVSGQKDLSNEIWKMLNVLSWHRAYIEGNAELRFRNAEYDDGRQTTDHEVRSVESRRYEGHKESTKV